MKRISEFKIIWNGLNIWIMLLFSLGYGLAYSVIFGLLASGGILQKIFQGITWTIFYSYFFMGIGIGVSAFSLCNILISYGMERNRIAGIWSKAATLVIVYYIALLGLAAAVLWMTFHFGENLTDEMFGLNFARLMMMAQENWMQLVAMFVIVVGLGILIMMVSALLALLGGKYGWKIATGVALLLLSAFAYFGISNIQILVMTRHNIYHYAVGLPMASFLMYLVNLVLIRKMEVKI